MSKAEKELRRILDFPQNTGEEIFLRRASLGHASEEYLPTLLAEMDNLRSLLKECDEHFEELENYGEILEAEKELGKRVRKAIRGAISD